ncbi:hypothetical protein DFH09DRAFT_1134176, partial [Mycena vulgaris]
MRNTQLRHSEFLSPSWPEAKLIDKLVANAHGLFIWAAVACSYIGQFDPTNRITQIIENTATRGRAEKAVD